MNLTRHAEAPVYDPPDHVGMRCVRLQGQEAGPSDVLWLGVSHLLPGGHTSFSASPFEKHYVVLEGSLTVLTDSVEETLEPWDSCRLAPGEQRRLENRTDRIVSVLLAMPLAPEKVARPDT